MSPRDYAFDFVKGILVLLMVVYHVMSIMSTAGPDDFRYIRFISGSFIFVSGYIVAQFFESRFERDPVATSKRLMARGLKLLAIFTALNMLIHTTGIGNADKLQLGPEGFWSHASSIYLQGDGSISSFLILLPIAYLLIMAPVFLLASALKRPAMAFLMLAGALTSAAMPAVTGRSAVLEFMLVGVAGLCAGLLAGPGGLPPIRFALRRPLALMGLALSLWLTGQLSDNVATYTIGIAIVLKCLYELVPLESVGGPLARGTALLGRYSLASYIAQIVLIQTLFRLFGKQRWPLGAEIAAFCLVTGMALVGLCLLLDRLRARSAAVDRSYRLIFS